MDKVQVDMKKLQLLNDRINQAIDALNQVRLTAQQPMFGLSHTSAQPYAFSPFAQVPTPFGMPGFPVSPFGLSHTPWADPVAIARQQIELAALIQSRTAGVPVGNQVGVGYHPGMGLGHTTASIRSPFDAILGVIDPVSRQAEAVRASEANRAWEVAQGLSHSSYPNYPTMGVPGFGYATNPYVAGFPPVI